MLFCLCQYKNKTVGEGFDIAVSVFGSIERFIGILTEHFRRGVPYMAGTGTGKSAADHR